MADACFGIDVPSSEYPCARKDLLGVFQNDAIRQRGLQITIKPQMELMGLPQERMDCQQLELGEPLADPQTMNDAIVICEHAGEVVPGLVAGQPQGDMPRAGPHDRGGRDAEEPIYRRAELTRQRWKSMKVPQSRFDRVEPTTFVDLMVFDR